VGGVANSINIIDGFHGLSGFTVLVILGAIGSIAYQVNDLFIYQLCCLVAVCVAGFLVVNYPLGKIFLGDGGAYLLGFILGWVALLLSERNAEVSPWAGLLACGYPIIEVIYSMYRRKRKKLVTGHPDLLHLHSLVKFRFIRKYWGSWSTDAQNAFVVIWINLFSVIPALWACLFYRNTLLLVLGFILSCILYIYIYRYLETQPEIPMIENDT
jgi:UDP-N-acetylmuramyl pentapeptide phosphotransferase/UDP-N-acetylglucosamine-1-phosphate transferase